MTATNHALTGALIGLTISNPLIAIPLAFVSHYVLDAIPHSGSEQEQRIFLRSKRFLSFLIADALVCIILVIALAASRPTDWLLGAVCAFVATSPDFMWVSKFVAARRKKPIPHYHNPLVRLHSYVQWFQKPIGGLVEAAWFLGAVFLLGSILFKP